MLLLAALGLAAVVGTILAVGWAVDTLVRANDVAAVVEGDVITTGQVLQEMRPAAQAIDAQARQVSGGQRNASIAQAVDQQKRSLPDDALDALVEQRILEHEAARRGVTVSPEDVGARLRENVAEFDLLSTPSPTPEASPSPTAEASPTAQATPAGTPTPVPTLPADRYQDALKRLLDQVSLGEDRYRALLARQLVQDRLQEAFGTEVPTSQEQVHARHILLDDEAKAKEVLQQLQDGADFGDLAKQVSTDPSTKDKGGDLGWLPRGIMNDAFENAAFALQPGQRSGVVQSPNGYHVVEVLERDPNRPVNPDQLTALKQRAFSSWLSARRSSPDVKLELDRAERDWTLRQIGVRP